MYFMHAQADYNTPSAKNGQGTRLMPGALFTKPVTYIILVGLDKDSVMSSLA